MAVPPLLATLSTVALLLVGGMRVMDGVLTIGMLVAFHSLSHQLHGAGHRPDRSRRARSRRQKATSHASTTCCATRPTRRSGDHRRPSAATTVVRLRGHVELRNVTFGYSHMDPPLIEDLSLTIQPGSRVALVGGSAAASPRSRGSSAGSTSPGRARCCSTAGHAARDAARNAEQLDRCRRSGDLPVRRTAARAT